MNGTTIAVAVVTAVITTVVVTQLMIRYPQFPGLPAPAAANTGARA